RRPMQIQQLWKFLEIAFGGPRLAQHLLFIAKCNLTLADNSASISGCGSAQDIQINDPYPGSNATQFKMYVWAFKTKTSPASIGNNFPSLVSFCTSLPCNSVPEISSNQFYYVMAIKSFNSAPTKVNFAVTWDIECNTTPPTSGSKATETKNPP
ncbi:14608_t:CDS:2, partial [Racocetra persica]